jgi:hypothetical protein
LITTDAVNIDWFSYFYTIIREREEADNIEKERAVFHQ